MKKIAIVAALLPLTACINFGSEPPSALMTLSPALNLEAGETVDSGDARAVTIRTPEVPQELATVRVPVQATDTSIAYVKDAQWVEQPASMFARLLGDTIAARTGRVIIGERQAIGRPGANLSGALRAFGIDARANEARVVYDASLMREGSTTFERRRFTASVPVTAIERDAVGSALNQAANQVASDVADWIGE
ncbi:ABC-type transport auxiliary lipoprotein family protein [Stakelama tenebrarum]|uniref:ABC transporter n=1 Tax=Stakelama tenebrarum TaxID=2711215 RepID=A0A6G6Y1V9_9SPHN|nr:ABC-type transport auxiliary lipoprotein family protein [Sphingosinithalassobacter tenebrarum]QIG78890.1 ABC transporter [Sphingosinithalassobacter tenebrarum]